MTPNFARLLGDCWLLFRREADIILRVAGATVFLPALALQLLVPGPPPLPQSRAPAKLEAWVDAVGLWGQSYGFWYLLVDGIALFGMGAILLLLVDPARPDVREAFGRSVRLLPRWALATILTGIPVGLGLWFFILPGLYIQARLVAAGPELFADQPVSASAAIARSWRMTRGGAFALFGATTMLMLASWLATSPLLTLDGWLRAAGHENPAVLSLVDALMAGIQTGYELALTLLGVVAWRAFARRGI